MRDISLLNEEQLSASLSIPVLFFRGDFRTDTIYLWSGLGNIEWGGHTWLGVGDFGQITDVVESGDVRANGLNVALTGIPQELISLVLQEVRWTQDCDIYLGFMEDDSGTFALVDDPVLLFKGKMDAPVLDEGADTATITISIESRLIDLERPRVRRYTDQDQKQLFPGDRGLEYVASLQDKNIVWGKS